MKKYKKFVFLTMLSGIFIAMAIPLSVYILSLPLSQITDEGCNGFSGYHLTNCITFYRQQGEVDILQHYAYTALWILWIGLFIIGACSFLVFPRIFLARTQQVSILLLGLFITLLLACLPLILFAEIIINGFIFALSLVIGFLAFELALASSTKRAVDAGEPVSSIP